jgi:ABC-type bacteriocin/lantibiotic exporter with double-glycine peptidase domain
MLRSAAGRAARRSLALGLLALTFVACATVAPTARPKLSDDWVQVSRLPLVRQAGPADCGSAALAMVLGHWAVATPPARLRDELAPPDRDGPGLAAGRLREEARQRGFRAYLVEGTWDDLRHEVAEGRPVLVGVVRRDGKRVFKHYEVIAGINPRENRVLSADPARGWREDSRTEFEKRWLPARNLTLVLWPDPDARALGHPPVARHNEHRQKPN